METIVFERLFGGNRRVTARPASSSSDSFAQEEAAFSRRRQQRADDYADRRAAILQAGGASLDHRPGYADSWEAAIQRLVQEGDLREQIDYGAFPQTRTYHYSLTPSGERAAARLTKAGTASA